MQKSLIHKRDMCVCQAVVPWSVERLLHKKCHLLVVDRIPLGETIPAINTFYVLYGPYSHRHVLLKIIQRYIDRVQ